MVIKKPTKNKPWAYFRGGGGLIIRILRYIINLVRTLLSIFISKKRESRLKEDKYISTRLLQFVRVFVTMSLYKTGFTLVIMFMTPLRIFYTKLEGSVRKRCLLKK